MLGFKGVFLYNGLDRFGSLNETSWYPWKEVIARCYCEACRMPCSPPCAHNETGEHPGCGIYGVWNIIGNGQFCLLVDGYGKVVIAEDGWVAEKARAIAVVDISLPARPDDPWLWNIEKNPLQKKAGGESLIYGSTAMALTHSISPGFDYEAGPEYKLYREDIQDAGWVVLGMDEAKLLLSASREKWVNTKEGRECLQSVSQSGSWKMSSRTWNSLSQSQKLQLLLGGTRRYLQKLQGRP